MSRARVLAILLSGAAACGSATAALAHPHVWATVRSEIVFGPDKKIVGIRHAWTFDEFYTAMAVQGLDTDKDGTYSKEELAPLAKVNVESLQEFAYFTFVSQGEDEKPLPLKPPVDYWLDYDKSVVTLHFTLPLEAPLDASVKQVTVNVFDPSFFVAFGFATEVPVKLTGEPAPSCAVKVEAPDKEQAEDAKALTEAFFSQLGPDSNYGLQFAQTAIVKCGSL